MSCSWKSGRPSPERVSCERMAELLLPGSLSACAFFGPAFWQCLASLAVSTPLLDVTVAVRFRLTVCARSCVLVLLTFRLPNSIWHSERCKVRSERVVSVTVCLWHLSAHLSCLSPFFRHVFHLSRASFAVFWVTEQCMISMHHSWVPQTEVICIVSVSLLYYV